MSTLQVPTAEQGPVVYGKYQLLELLARGGMAEVFKAKSHGVEGFEKILVIKRILPELGENSEFVEMFINEAKIAVTLSHANIVQVFDLGRADETYFIAMEYVAGYDLATLLRRARKFGKPLSHELAVYIVSEVAKGLDYAHRRRDGQMRPLHIVHRDVSPQNILLSYEGEVKLTDFGIAKARISVEQQSEAGVLKGKYAYMAPEQARDGGVDGRTDLFALGTVLYEALAGTNPFLAPSTYETIKRVRHGVCAPLLKAAPDVPEELSAIVGRAMSPQPDERHPNAGRLYEDLIQFLYASGRRVGAHELAGYLEEMRVLTERRRKPQEDAQLRAAFEGDARAARVKEGAERTPVEIPGVRSSTPGPDESDPRRPKVSTTGVSPHAERRDVTVLALQAPRDEPVPDSRIRQLLHRFGGMLVEQDRNRDDEGERRRTVALFGAKDPDGYDTEAAARCAIRIMRAADAAAEGTAGSTLQLAVHSGRVLFDLSGELIRDQRYERLVGEGMDVAARAREGRTLVTPAAERAIRMLFELVPDGDDPTGCSRLEGEREVSETLGKFIGRRDELRRIGEVLALANKGTQRVLGIVGHPGSGKSRLLTETRRRLHLGGHDVGMYVTRIPRHTRDVPLAGCQEMLRVILGVDEFDPEPVIREKVARLRELGLPRPEIAAVEVALGLRDETQDAAAGDRPLRAALARMATKLAEDRLTVFAFDGLDAMDAESMSLIHGLLGDASSSRLLWLLAYRPGLEHPWKSSPDYYEIELEPFSDQDVARLTASRLGATEVPAELLREVTAKSGGNPLYVEEYLHALRDAAAVEVQDGSVHYDPEVAAVEVPKTLRGIVASRLARLTTTQRHLLQVAAVAGARFSPALLADVSGESGTTVEDALTTLEKRGIVERQSATEYGFTHELFRNVLRDGLTLEARREMHGAICETLERLHPEHIDEMAERLAQHARDAGHPSKAADYLVRAADRLESEQALGGAIQNLVKAIDTLSQMPSPDRDRVLSLYRRVGALSFRSRDLEPGAERMAAALSLAEGLGRDDYVTRFSMMRGRMLANANRISEAQPWLERARQVARQLGNGELLRDVTLATAEAFSRNGEWVRAIAPLSEALELARETADVQALMRCLIPLAQCYAGTGDRERSIQALEEARQLVAEHPDPYTECELLKNDSLVAHFLGDHRRCIDSGSRALELAKEYGLPYEMSVNAHNIGETFLRLGDYKKAFANLRYSYEVAREHGFIKLQYNNMRVLGFIDAVKFGSEEGRARVVEACQYASDNGYIWDLIQAKYMLALVDYRQGHGDKARQGFREVLQISAEYGNRHYESDAERALRAIDAGEPVPLPS